MVEAEDLEPIGHWVRAHKIVEADELGEALKWEPSRGGALFPHLYGPLRLSDVRWSRPLQMGLGGHVFPDDMT